MPCIEYRTINFTEATRKIILSANAIIRQYRAEGYILTLRQLYYQFVARLLIANKQTEYNRLGSIINDARLAGFIDWESIEDRTRNLQVLSHWDSPADIINSAAVGYREDVWKDQDYRVEVWIEKDALLGVIENVCEEFDVPYFSCRGYVSQSEMWLAAHRIIGHEQDGKRVIILHLGDHDPSGLDMTRDIRDRLELFEANPEVIRIALTEDQIAEYEPPPNPAKITDCRYENYVKEHGEESWELDALEPKVLSQLIYDTISDNYIDLDKWEESKESIERGKKKILKLAATLKAEK